MRGVGEPILEHDFPSGSDMIQEILSGPKAAEVMEAHLFDRLSSEEFSSSSYRTKGHIEIEEEDW